MKNSVHYEKNSIWFFGITILLVGLQGLQRNLRFTN